MNVKHFSIIAPAFHDDEYRENQKELISELNDYLSSIGIKISYEYKTFTDTSKENECFSISWDPEEVKKKMGRNAGPREKSVLDEEGLAVSLSKAQEMIKLYGVDATAQKLQIGRATLYRKLKAAQNTKKELSDADLDIDPYL